MLWKTAACDGVFYPISPENGQDNPGPGNFAKINRPKINITLALR